MECHFRVGNERYSKKYKSYGTTTLENKHVKVKKDHVIIDFVGKKKVRNICTIRNKKVVKTVFTFGSDEAQQRARYLTQNLEEGIAKAVAMQIKTSEKSSFSMRDIEGYILSQTITNNTITNEIKKRSDAYKNTFISDNVRYLKDVDIDIWAATTKDNDEEELVRLSYLSGRTQIVDSALGTTNEIKNNIAKVRRLKHILSSEGFTKSEKVIAKKELLYMSRAHIPSNKKNEFVKTLVNKSFNLSYAPGGVICSTL